VNLVLNVCDWTILNVTEYAKDYLTMGGKLMCVLYRIISVRHTSVMFVVLLVWGCPICRTTAYGAQDNKNTSVVRVFVILWRLIFIVGKVCNCNPFIFK